MTTVMTYDCVFRRATLITMQSHAPFGLMQHAALAVKDGVIAWLGAEQDLPSHHTLREVDVEHRCISPGLIDCHTHLVYAGNRAHEFAMRAQGKTYQEIAFAGGGILSTVKATRAASEEELIAQSVRRLRALHSRGVVAVEIKSGYGLDFETELKMLRVIQRLKEYVPVDIVATCLAAHTIPPEFQNNADGYIDFVCEQLLPRVAVEKLASAVDVFCEKIAFTLAQTERVFQTAQKLNLKIKCHAEQLSAMGAAQLAARYQALSADHLEFATEESIAAMAASGTVAVLLPGAFYFLREKQVPPVELLRRYRVPMALATDCNPGTSPITSLPVIMNMASVLFKMTPEEIWEGVTCHAASALGISGTHGLLEVGRAAKLVMWEAEHPVEVVNQVGIAGECIIL